MTYVISVKRILLVCIVCGLGLWGIVPPSSADLIDNDDGTITDTQTSLTWQQETQGDMDWREAMAYCETLTLGGKEDWRLPTLKELASIVDLSRYSPAVNTFYFPDTVKTKYWTSTTKAQSPAEGWYVDFTYGDDGTTAKTGKYKVRAVRGGPPGQPPVTPSTFYDNGNGTITDSRTGLTWQQVTQPAATWKDALAACSALEIGGQTDWRLPTIKELETLVSLSRTNPAVNTFYFPDTTNVNYWSSTTRLENPSYAWVMKFDYGSDAYLSKNATAVFRAVRGGTETAPDASQVFQDNGNGTVTDYNTGLTWSKATITGKSWQEAIAVCDNLNLGGFSDWRLPTIKELAGIVSLKRYSPAINTFYFPDTASAKYWTATTKGQTPSEAWAVDFTYGDDTTVSKTTLLNVRPVRGGAPKYPPNTPVTWIDNGDGTVTDHTTGLMWQKGHVSGKNWKEALAACVQLDLGGYGDWRMPTIKELETLVSLRRYNPAINTFYFPDTANANYWSSTTRSESPSDAWVMKFDYGSDAYLAKTATTAYVRAVRSGPAPGTCFLLGTVYDAVTGKPLMGVPVTVDGSASGVTDASGVYYITGLSCGQHTVTVIVSGYVIYSRTIIAGEGGSFDIGLTRSNTVYGSASASGYSADPVNTATGNYVYTKKDMELPGIGMPFVFERTYNSQDGTDGPLGYGWSHSYHPVLTVDATGVAVLRWGDGKTQTWLSDGSGGYVRQYGVFDDLIDNGDGTHTLKKTTGIRYRFDAVGQLIDITDTNGNVVALIRNGGLLTRIVDTAGRFIDFAYNSDGRILTVTDLAGREVHFDYDEDGNLIAATDLNGHTTRFTYDDRHQVLTITDPRGNVVVTNTYDENKRVVTCQKDAKQGETRYVYEDVDHRTVITDAMGHQTIHVHDDLLRLVSETDALGRSTSYAYDDLGNRTQITDKRGGITRYTYDANGNVLSKTDALNQRVQIEYDVNNNPIRRTDALGRTTVYQYDERGNLIRTSDAIGNVNAYTYDPKGLKLTQTDANGQVTMYGYDAYGNRNLVRNPEGNETRYTYDVSGRLLTVTDPLGRTTQYGYDGMGNVIREIYPDGTSKQYVFDENGNKVQEMDESGHIRSFQYDVKNLLVSITDPLNGTWAYTYDALDRKTSETDPRGYVTQFAYDAVGNLVQRTNAVGAVTSYTYDEAGNRISETNAAGNTWRTSYDLLNRVVTQTDPLGNMVRKTYDAAGQMISLTDAAGNVTSMSYDVRGRLVAVTDPAGGTAHYTYDGNGNRTAMTDPAGHVTRYRYDRANRLIEMVEPMGGTTTYGYDALGNRTSLTDPNGNTLLYAYDERNRLTRIDRAPGEWSGFVYSATGLRTKMTDSTLGETIYAYDASGRLISVVDPFGQRVEYQYDLSGNQTAMIYPDGKTVGYAYDGLNRMISVTDWNGRKTFYDYGQSGDLVRVRLPNGVVTTMEYDAVRRLTGLASRTSDSRVIVEYGFSLDALGNHKTVTRNEPVQPDFVGIEVPYRYDAENRLTQAGSTERAYDANGNLVQTGNRRLVYDAQDRLKETNFGGNVSSYTYDGDGYRLVRTTSEGQTRYVFDRSRKLPMILAETSSQGEITAYYLYGLGLLAKILPNGAAQYYHFDAQGNTVAITDGGQNVVSAYAYGPFGEVKGRTGETTNPFTFLGRYGVMTEGEGFYAVRARYYLTEDGRFINKDIRTGDLLVTQSLNRYVYGLNNPVMLVDPDGEVWQCLIGAAVGAIWSTGSYLMEAAVTGEFSGAALGGAMVGGAVTGALYTINPVLATAIGSTAGNVSRELFEKYDRDPSNDAFDTEKVVLNVATDTVLSAGTSFLSWGLPRPKGALAKLPMTKYVTGTNIQYYEVVDIAISGVKAFTKGFMKRLDLYPESTEDLLRIYGGKPVNRPYVPETTEVYVQTHRSYVK